MYIRSVYTVAGALSIVVIIFAFLFHFQNKGEKNFKTIINGNRNVLDCSGHVIVGGNEDFFEDYQNTYISGGSPMGKIVKDAAAFKVENCTDVEETGSIDGEFTVLTGQNKGKNGWTLGINLHRVAE